MPQPVSDAGELPDLLFIEELRLVDEDAVDLGVFVVLGDARKEVVALAEHLGLGLKPDARGDVALAGLAVVAGHEQHRRHAALAIIVGRLQKHGRLAGIHGRVVEVELGHGLS